MVVLSEHINCQEFKFLPVSIYLTLAFSGPVVFSDLAWVVGCSLSS